MKRTKAILCLFLTVFAVFTGGAQASVVLCIEANGEIRLEDTSDRCCFETSSASNRERSESSTIIQLPPESSCGPCVDIAIPVGGKQTSVTRPEQPKLPTFAPPIASTLDALPGALGWEKPTVFKTSPHSDLPRLRSVVLRF